MRTFKPEAWLPTTKKEVEAREWDYIDVILFSGDAYVDHPSFGAAVIGRTLEAMGLRVAIVPQPDWRGDYRDFKKLGAPRLFFGVSAGAMDSMINHYTANAYAVTTLILRTVVPACARIIPASFTRRY